MLTGFMGLQKRGFNKFKPNKAFEFSGVNQGMVSSWQPGNADNYIYNDLTGSTGNTGVNIFKGDWTMSFWIRAETLSGAQDGLIISCIDAYTQYKMWIYYEGSHNSGTNGKINVMLRGGDANKTLHAKSTQLSGWSSSSDDGPWRHIVVTFDASDVTASIGDSINIYVDGSDATESCASTGSSTITTSDITSWDSHAPLCVAYAREIYDDSGTRKLRTVSDHDDEKAPSGTWSGQTEQGQFYFAEYGIWYSELTSANATTLFNSGSPGDLSKVNPSTLVCHISAHNVNFGANTVYNALQDKTCAVDRFHPQKQGDQLLEISVANGGIGRMSTHSEGADGWNMNGSKGIQWHPDRNGDGSYASTTTTFHSDDRVTFTNTTDTVDWHRGYHTKNGMYRLEWHLTEFSGTGNPRDDEDEIGYRFNYLSGWYTSENAVQGDRMLNYMFIHSLEGGTDSTWTWPVSIQGNGSSQPYTMDEIKLHRVSKNPDCVTMACTSHVDIFKCEIIAGYYNISADPHNQTAPVELTNMYK